MVNKQLKVEIEERKLVEQALRESESKFRSLFDFSPQPVALTEVESGRFIDVNEKLCELSLFAKEELLGRTTTELELFAVEDRMRVIKELETSGTVNGLEMDFRTKDGSIINTLMFSKVIDLEGKKLLLSIFVEMTEREQLETQLQQARKMEALGTMVAGVAHEVNNPINTITLNLPLLKRIWHDFQPILRTHAQKEPQRKYGGLSFEYLAEKLPRLLSGMDMAANRVARIATGLKDFARQSSIAEKKSIRVNAAVENAMLLAQNTLQKSAVDLELNLTGDLPLMMGDLQSMEQIILNLTLNAIQAIDHDQGRIKIRTGIQETDAKIFISVSDNGRGIAPSISDKIFDPFVTTRQAQGGTGLGLSVTYNLVKAQDGEITFRSQEGKGTTFRVVFPAKLREEAAKILIVDDEETVRSAIAYALTQNRPYVVEAVASGTEALIKLGAQRPDLLILDIFMPEMDGLEVCRVLKNEPGLSDMKVVIITGFPDNPKLEKIIALGYTHIMVKPLDLHHTLKVVDEILK